MADHRPIANEENVLSFLLHKYLPFWPFFVGLLMLGLLLARVYIYVTVPNFEATAKIIIKDEKRGVDDLKITESMNAFASKKIVENEIEVIKSRLLMRKVVDQLGLYAPVYQQRFFRADPLYMLSPVSIRLKNPQMLVQGSNQFDKIPFLFDSKHKFISIAGKKYASDVWIKTPYGELQFISNRSWRPVHASFYFSLLNPVKTTDILLSKLEVIAASKSSTVVNLKIKDATPERATDILNHLLAEYSQRGILEKNSLAANTLAFLEDRMHRTEIELDAIEKRVGRYRSTKGAVNLSEQGRQFLENTADNNSKIAQTNLQLAILQKVEKYVVDKNNAAGIVPSTLGVNDPVLSRLLERLYDAEIEYEKLRKTTAENNPVLESVSDQIRKIRPSIIENVRGQQVNLLASLADLDNTSAKYNSVLESIPEKERELVQISREQNGKLAIYNFLLQKREEAALSNSSADSDSRIVDQAESSADPVGLNTLIIYLIADALALGLGISVITGWELLNRTILFRQEIEELTSFTVVGEIARQQVGSGLLIEQGVDSVIAEQFRLLRTTLPFLGVKGEKKTVLITSTISGEGKSFIAANLGMSLAMAGRKVVLVEFDLSNPSLAGKLDLPYGLGLGDYLKNKVQIAEITQASELNTNLHLIQAGQMTENPSELIWSDRTADLFAYLTNNYDYVLVDSAPVGHLSDAYVLSKFCDATLYIVRHRHTPKKVLEYLEKNNRINELTKLGIIFNGVNSRGLTGGQLGYSHGYGYGYGYSHKKTKKLVQV